MCSVACFWWARWYNSLAIVRRRGNNVFKMSNMKGFPGFDVDVSSRKFCWFVHFSTSQTRSNGEPDMASKILKSPCIMDDIIDDAPKWKY